MLFRKKHSSRDAKPQRDEYIHVSRAKLEELLDKGSEISRNADKEFRDVRRVCEEDMRLLLN